jgi:hypothetical protein
MRCATWHFDSQKVHSTDHPTWTHIGLIKSMHKEACFYCFPRKQAGQNIQTRRLIRDIVGWGVVFCKRGDVPSETLSELEIRPHSHKWLSQCRKREWSWSVFDGTNRICPRVRVWKSMRKWHRDGRHGNSFIWYGTNRSRTTLFIYSSQ